MKTKKSLLISLLGLLLIGCYSCQRYDDGPLFSFSSPEKRLAKKWQLINIYKVQKVDGSYHYDEISSHDSITVEFKKNNDFFGWAFNYATISDTGSRSSFAGIWKLTDNKKDIECTGQITDVPEPYPATLKYEITQLKSGDLWITENYYSETPPGDLIGRLDFHFIPY